MSSNDNVLERIELYTKGKMSFEEQQAFEHEMAMDDTLRNKVELSRIADLMIVGEEAMKLKEQMRRDLRKPKSNKGFYSGLALLLGLGGAIYLASSREVVPPRDSTDNINPEKIKTEVSKKESVKVDLNKREERIAPKVSQSKVVITPAEEMPSYTAQMKVEEVEKKDEPVAMEEKPQVLALPVAKDKNTALDPCLSLKGEVAFYTVPSCKGRETGEVHVKSETVSGGLAPYTFVLGDKKSSSVFEHLASGSYTLGIRDANNCYVEIGKKVIVSEKKCNEQKQYVFNPDYDHAWTIPYNMEKQAKHFKVLEKSGRVFYETFVSDLAPAEWRGESNTGMALSIGLYFFEIEYADGSVEEGVITISR